MPKSGRVEPERAVRRRTAARGLETDRTVRCPRAVPHTRNRSDRTILALDTDSIPPAGAAGFEAVARAAPLTAGAVFLGADLDGSAAVRRLQALRVRVCGVAQPVVPGVGDTAVPCASLLAAPEPAIAQRALDGLRAFAIRVARFGAPVVPLDLGALTPVDGPGSDDARREAARTWALDRVLPALHAAASLAPDVVFAVRTPDAGGWPTPDDLAIVLGELKRRNIGWWFDAATTHRAARAGGPSVDAWCTADPRRLAGIGLRDTGGDEHDVPLGSGEVDWRLAAQLAARERPSVVRVDAKFGVDAVRESIAFATERGLG